MSSIRIVGGVSVPTAPHKHGRSKSRSRSRSRSKKH
jgi:hypothetical protein